jgi:uncharacterized membrane protein (UPF0127 family)
MEIINKMKNNKIATSLSIIFIFFIAGFFLISHSSPKIKPETPNNIYVQIAGQSIKVDLSITPAQQEQGLSGRKSLSQNEGMLFVFDKPSKPLFWMPNMNFPIDIIWITEDLKVAYIKKNALPKLYPETYGPGENDNSAKYVLEVVSGFSDSNNLKVGDSVKFSYQ